MTFLPKSLLSCARRVTLSAPCALSAGADVNVGDLDGKTPYMCVIVNKFAGPINFLTAKGTDMNVVNKAGKMAFDIANERGFIRALNETRCEFLEQQKRVS